MITLKKGDKAPAFKGLDQEGKKISLADFKGKKLVLYFYPAANTPTCTVESCNLRDNFTALKKKGFQVVGVSPDEVNDQKKFADKHSLPFPLLADADKTVCMAYGVWDKKSMYGREYMGVLRTTFLIDEKGRIERIILKPKSKIHAEEIISKG
ncbi:MAG: thioredoxin-dependent thiol peroxidase [Chitinophagaceae bacterium]|nr:thioredoxin-dependent thiol peroxidase [Chitinophagaceae bacterium]